MENNEILLYLTLKTGFSTVYTLLWLINVINDDVTWCTAIYLSIITVINYKLGIIKLKNCMYPILDRENNEILVYLTPKNCVMGCLYIVVINKCYQLWCNMMYCNIFVHNHCYKL